MKKQVVKLNGCSRMYVFISHPSTLYIFGNNVGAYA